MRRAFDQEGKKVGDVRELWHGTRASNLLSILKAGFVIPPSNAPHCTGRMFGNGVYFSDQSTKSLNYAYGYWGGGSRDETCYMFLCDVAMGKSYTPLLRSAGLTLPKSGTDSTFAKAGISGVVNNEMIVYRTCQVNPTFLVEFGPTGK
jgi:poly [ADP-ribose] polymerase